MANVKISELPVVTSVANSDVLPVVASTTTSQLTMTSLANSMPQVSSSISASFAISASYAPGGTSVIAVSGSTLYSTNPPTSNFNTQDGIFLGRGAGFNATNASNSNFFGSGSGLAAVNANDSNFFGTFAGQGATNSFRSNFIGYSAGQGSANANDSNFIGYQAGIATNAQNSNFIGTSAGLIATNAQNSNFIGSSAGNGATNAQDSNFIGLEAGYNAAGATRSNFIGYQAGTEATSGSYSNFIGYQAGAYAASAEYSNLIGVGAGTNIVGNGIGRNNTIIGTYVSLENGRRDSINIGGVIFATGSYFSTNTLFSGSMTNSRVGINKSLPQYTLDVSGSGNYASGLTVTGSFVVTGSFIVPAQATANPATGSMYVEPAANKLWVYTGNSANGWVTASLGV